MKKDEFESMPADEFLKELKAEIEREKNKNIFLKIWDSIRYFPFRIKDKIRNYKIRHLKIGKTKYKNGKLYIEKPSWDVHWQTRNYLASIIRDYLKIFAKESPIIGNCVCEDIPDYFIKGLTESENDERYKMWIEKLNATAQLFDDITENWDEDENPEVFSQERVNKAFDALKEIFNDLSW